MDKGHACGECRHYADMSKLQGGGFCNAPVPPWAYRTRGDSVWIDIDCPYAETCPVFDPVRWPGPGLGAA